VRFANQGRAQSFVATQLWLQWLQAAIWVQHVRLADNSPGWQAGACLEAQCHPTLWLCSAQPRVQCWTPQIPWQQNMHKGSQGITRDQILEQTTLRCAKYVVNRLCTHLPSMFFCSLWVEVVFSTVTIQKPAIFGSPVLALTNATSLTVAAWNCMMLWPKAAFQIN